MMMLLWLRNWESCDDGRKNEEHENISKENPNLVQYVLLSNMKKISSSEELPPEDVVNVIGWPAQNLDLNLCGELKTKDYARKPSTIKTDFSNI